MQLESGNFPDPADRASHEQQLELERALQLARQKTQAAPTLAFIGECHNNCGEKLSDGLRFCCQECRDDYQHRMARRQANRGTLH